MFTPISRLCVAVMLGVMLGAAALLPPARPAAAEQRGPLVVTPTAQPPTPTDTPLPTATPTTPPTATPSAAPTATPSTPATATTSAQATATPSAPAATTTPSAPAATAAPSATARPTREPKPDSANPQIAKRVDRPEAQVGDEVVFTIVVTNPEPADAEDVVVTDRLASYFDLISAEASRGAVSVSGRTVSVDLGTLPSGDEVRIAIRVRLNDQAPEELSNVAQVVTSSSSNSTDDDTASAQLRRIGRAAGTTPTPTPTPQGQAPTAGAGGTPVPGAPTSAAPTPTPRRPRGLPNTGAPEPPYLPLLALGWCVLAGGLILHRRARRSG
jgi:uncharacterized repeat protein (TIGR01451 family)